MPDLEGGRGKLKTTSQIFGIRRKNKTLNGGPSLTGTII
jgi:hypothetical protein